MKSISFLVLIISLINAIPLHKRFSFYSLFRTGKSSHASKAVDPIDVPHANSLSNPQPSSFDVDFHVQSEPKKRRNVKGQRGSDFIPTLETIDESPRDFISDADGIRPVGRQDGFVFGSGDTVRRIRNQDPFEKELRQAVNEGPHATITRNNGIVQKSKKAFKYPPGYREIVLSEVKDVTSGSSRPSGNKLRRRPNVQRYPPGYREIVIDDIEDAGPGSFRQNGNLERPQPSKTPDRGERQSRHVPTRRIQDNGFIEK